jgi:hypothetical protein
MKSSQYWQQHFTENLKVERINWDLEPSITEKQKKMLAKCMQAWQLAETSDGTHLIAASKKHARQTNDPDFLSSVYLFIEEENKHGENLGKYLDRIHIPRVKADWRDSLFRKVRYHNTNMELWTLTVLTVESTAQVFYQSLKDATQCMLLRQICTDILRDEAYHINYQFERLCTIVSNKSSFEKKIRYYLYRIFFLGIITMVYLGNRKVFRAGGNNFNRYYRKMNIKFNKTFRRIFLPKSSVYDSQLKWEQIDL